MRPIKILVACGGGIATSSIAAAIVQEVCEEAGVKAQIQKSNILSVPAKAKDVDVALFTARYKNPLPCRSMIITSFITNTGISKTKEQLRELLLEIEKEINNN
jgi:PTS system galactitol-specific IIB component